MDKGTGAPLSALTLNSESAICNEVSQCLRCAPAALVQFPERGDQRSWTPQRGKQNTRTAETPVTGAITIKIQRQRLGGRIGDHANAIKRNFPGARTFGERSRFHFSGDRAGSPQRAFLRGGGNDAIGGV